MGLLWMWPGSRASSQVETVMLGNFLSCSNRVKDHLEVPKGPSHPFCNSRSSPTYPFPLERKHESPAHIQRSPVSAS